MLADLTQAEVEALLTAESVDARYGPLSPAQYSITRKGLILIEPLLIDGVRLTLTNKGRAVVERLGAE